MSTKNHLSLNPKTVLCVAAHPDDLEFTVGGSIASWIRQGAEVYYLVLTNGNKGSEDRTLSPEQLRNTRQQEQREAAVILGVKQVYFCDYNDGELAVSQDVKRDIVRIIRTVRPDTVLAFDPAFLYDARLGLINHSDHRAAGQATLDAVYPLARDHLAFPELLAAGLEPHKTAHVLLFQPAQATHYMDISQTLDKKVDSLKAHVSQFNDLARIESIVRDMAATAGKQATLTAAEAFTYIKVD